MKSTAADEIRAVPPKLHPGRLDEGHQISLALDALDLGFRDAGHAWGGMGVRVREAVGLENLSIYKLAMLY